MKVYLDISTRPLEMYKNVSDITLHQLKEQRPRIVKLTLFSQLKMQSIAQQTPVESFFLEEQERILLVI